jgi:hypothetical protein
LDLTPHVARKAIDLAISKNKQGGQMTDKPKLRIIDNPSVNETYFNKFIGAASDGHGVQIILGSQRILPPKTNSLPEGHPSVFVSARFVLSPEATVELVNALNNLLQAISKPADPLKRN